MTRAKSQDSDTLAHISGHRVCWRVHGSSSPNFGSHSLILWHNQKWINIGTWKRGPVDMQEIERLIDRATK